MSEWPLIERPLADHLTAATGFPWGNEGGTAVPRGIVQRVGGTGDLDLTDSPNVEVTVFATTRHSLWQAVRATNRAFANLNPGPIGTGVWVDEVGVVFGFTLDPDRGTSAYRVATATYTLTLRAQD